VTSTLRIRTPLRHRIAALGHRILDAVYSPVISRLSTDDYFASRTRNDCLRAFLRSRLAG